MLPKSSEVRFAAILEGSGEMGLYSAVFQEDQAFPLFKISDIQAPTHQYVHCISFWVEESLKTFFFLIRLFQSSYTLAENLSYSMHFHSRTSSILCLFKLYNTYNIISVILQDVSLYNLWSRFPIEFEIGIAFGIHVCSQKRFKQLTV